MMNSRSRDGITDLYHGQPLWHNNVAMWRPQSGHSRSTCSRTHYGVQRQWWSRLPPNKQEVLVEARFETQAIVRERWRSCLKILCMQTPGKYDDSGLGSPVFTKREQKLKEQKPREQLRLTCPMNLFSNPAVCCVTIEPIKIARYMIIVTNRWLLVLITIS